MKTVVKQIHSLHCTFKRPELYTISLKRILLPNTGKYIDKNRIFKRTDKKKLNYVLLYKHKK